MAYGEKGITVLAKTLIIMIMLIGQNPYSDMNNSLMKVVHIWNLEEISLHKFKMIIDDPFGGHLSYHSLDKTHMPSLAGVW